MWKIINKKVNPKSYEDIESYRLFDKEDRVFVIGSKSNDRYIIVKEEEVNDYLSILKDINGENTIRDLSCKWCKDENEVHNIIKLFYEKGLIKGDNNNHGNSEVNKLSVKLCSISLEKINNIPKWLVNMLVYTIILTIIISLSISVILLLYRGKWILYEGGYLKGIIWSMIIMLPSFIFHEICHALVALKYNLKPHCINIALYLGVFPLFYVKIKGLYTVTRVERIKVLLAGFMGNLFILALALVGYLVTNSILFIPICLAQINIILVNCNPFNLSDGYFISTQILKCINLRSRFFYLIANDIKGLINGERKFKLYTLASLIGVIISAQYFAKYFMLTISEYLGDIPNTNIISILIVGIMLIGYFLVIKIKWGIRNEA